MVAAAIIVVATGGAAAVFWRPGVHTPATVTTAVTSATATDSTDAESARTRERESERRASTAGAAEAAPGTYTSAVAVRRSAEGAFAERRYREAAVLFTQAGGLFDQARATAEATAPPAGQAHTPSPTRASAHPEVKTPVEPASSKETALATDDAPWMADLVASQAAKASAIDADAARYAPEEFTAAVGLEREARRLAEARVAGPAGARFRDATEVYRRAATRAVERRRDIFESLESLSALATSRRDALHDHAGLADYDEGVAALARADDLRAAGELPKAETSYREAVRRFDAAEAARTSDDAAIRKVIADYGQALEHESLADLERLHTTSPPTMEEAWRRFFDQVHDLHANLDVESLAFQKDGAALADVGVVLRYAGGSGSGTREHWRIRLVKTAAGWRIDDINRNP